MQTVIEAGFPILAILQAHLWESDLSIEFRVVSLRVRSWASNFSPNCCLIFASAPFAHACTFDSALPRIVPMHSEPEHFS